MDGRAGRQRSGQAPRWVKPTSINQHPPAPPLRPPSSSSQATRIYGAPTVLRHRGLVTQAAGSGCPARSAQGWWAQRGHGGSVDSGPVRNSMALRGRAQWDVPGRVPILLKAQNTPPCSHHTAASGMPRVPLQNSLRGDLTLQMPPPGSPLSLANTSSEPHTPAASKSPHRHVSDTCHLRLRCAPCWEPPP